MVVTRLGVRYINRIVLSGATIDFDDVLTVGPKVPNNMPQMLVGFFNRLVIPVSDEKATVAINQAMEAPPVPTELPEVAVLLDIDAFNEEPHPPSSDAVWSTLEQLRRAKNLAFFNSVTPKELEKMK